ncbi:unnamed protein product [Didymodactylos carnosus]|uniref:Cell division cycle protein 27 homolog n=1 Tax=Didymodactylos carnosus TaxID=1234261 RepID=A0A813PSA6_9BILA|nr:unnamed protein product [Didymodactylos carnosus]CAF0793846.1 unnamed protein product [Didymodactylos carnosus]CAF3537476.1 unnamed protein product [Didymodactylos carnosus]CAF3576693.1 unnamed protein product [Didymodactylos carnosus]
MSVPIDPVKLYINQFIQNFDYVDAIFLAERLYAEVKNEESTYLLARTYYLSGDVNKSYWLLRNSSIEHISTAKLLLAKCCFDIEKIHEAEAVLVGSWSSIDQLSLDDFVNEHGEQASFALQLLGKVCEKSDRVLKAGECYRRSLKLNPFLWSSFQALCNLGERVDTSIFCSSALKLPSRTVPDIQPNVCTSPCIESPKDQINENQIIEQTNVNNNIKQTQQQIVKLADNLLNVGTTINVGLITSTPIDRIADSDQDLIDKFTPPTIMTPTWVPSLRNPPLAPKRTNNRVGQQFEYDESSTSTSTTALVATITSHHRREATSATINDTRKTTSTRKAQRRVGATQQTSVLGTYGNVISQTNTQTRTTPTTSITTRTQTPLSSDAIKENTKSVRTLPKRNQRPKSTRVPCSEMGLTTPTSFESPTKMTTRSQVRHSNTNNTSINGEIEITNKKDKLRKIQLTHHRTSEIVENILNVLKLLGEGLQHLSLYECRQAVDIFESITIKHLDTPYVLSNLALSLYHLHDYQKASLIYRQLRTKFPYHIDGLEYYSTVLWQLKDDVALATLAHELTETHRKHPAVSSKSERYGLIYIRRKKH